MTSEPCLLLIRADAGPQHGFGHVMRCLALTQAAMAAGCQIAWVTAECPPGAKARLSSEGVNPVILDAIPGSPEDADATAAIADDVGADWIVLDGYHFGPDYQDRLTASGRPVLYLDDNGIFPRYPANLVLNQNPYAAAAMYHGLQDESLLLGPPFLLLRREFR
jgi:spore coat polysaccharide biosynthesis predicted glycosyltransferase SpsG